MAWRAALAQHPEGVMLQLAATPGARQQEFPAGYDPWRNRIGVRVRAAAQEGRANADIVRLVARTLGVPARDVTLAAGAADARKAVLVRGLTVAQAEARLEAALGRAHG